MNRLICNLALVMTLFCLSACRWDADRLDRDELVFDLPPQGVADNPKAEPAAPDSQNTDPVPPSDPASPGIPGLTLAQGKTPAVTVNPLKNFKAPLASYHLGYAQKIYNWAGLSESKKQEKLQKIAAAYGKHFGETHPTELKSDPQSVQQFLDFVFEADEALAATVGEAMAHTNYEAFALYETALGGKNPASYAAVFGKMKLLSEQGIYIGGLINHASDAYNFGLVSLDRSLPKEDQEQMNASVEKYLELRDEWLAANFKTITKAFEGFAGGLDSPEYDQVIDGANVHFMTLLAAVTFKFRTPEGKLRIIAFMNFENVTNAEDKISEICSKVDYANYTCLAQGYFGATPLTYKNGENAGFTNYLSFGRYFPH